MQVVIRFLIWVYVRNGELAVLLKKYYNDNIDVIAIDPSVNAIQFAIDNYSSYHVTYKKAIVEDFGEEHDGTFDFIMFSKSLHHCEDIKHASAAAVSFQCYIDFA